MNTDTLTRSVREELARLTGTVADDWFFVFRARQGIETILRAVASVHGSGEVITQPFTCTTALNPILSAGFIPSYIDASLDTLSLDTTHLQANSSSRAIIMQHSFGIESDMKKARTFANKRHLLLIEDSAHHLGMLARKGDEPLADVSVHSFGVEKMLPTKFGGAVWVNPAMKDSAVRSAIIESLSQLPFIDRKTRGKARRYRFMNRLLNRTPRSLEPLMRKMFISLNLFQPAIMPEELLGRNFDPPAKPNNWVLKKMLEGLKKYSSIIENRRSVTAVYLQDFPVNLTLPKSISEGFAPVRLPVLCENKLEATRLFSVLRENGHYSGKWYMPTIFPGVVDPGLYNYDPELFPVAENISSRILNLPTNITVREAKEILDVLHRETD